MAAVIGHFFGIAMGMSPLIARIIDPWIAALYPLPKISLIPLLIIWLGTGEPYKIVISAVTAFFPIVICTFAAIRQVDSRPDQSREGSRREDRADPAQDRDSGGTAGYSPACSSAWASRSFWSLPPK